MSPLSGPRRRAAFKARGDLSRPFDDDVHLDDTGDEAFAQAWFEGITRGRAAAPSSRVRRFGFSIGGWPPG